jgi:hypothetical protein
LNSVKEGSTVQYKTIQDNAVQIVQLNYFMNLAPCAAVCGAVCCVVCVSVLCCVVLCFVNLFGVVRCSGLEWNGMEYCGVKWNVVKDGA